MPNITFLEAGGASTGGTQLWTSTSNTWVVDTSVKPSNAYSSLRKDHNVNFGGSLSAQSVVSGANRFSFYFRFTELPAARRYVVQLTNNLDDPVGAITLNTSGQLEWAVVNSSIFTAGSTVLSANTWYRISCGFNNNGTSNDLDANVYLDSVNEISVTGQGTANTSLCTRFYLRTDQVVGGSTQSGLSYYYAHIYVDDGDDLSDTGDRQCTAKFPTTVNTNDWDTVGGTGAVNERPLDEANYMEQAGASQVSQNYNIAGRTVGDVNINTATVVGYMGWAWAKESAVSGTPKLTVNGTDYAVTLTTSPATYRQCVTNNLYPSDSATIGMVSSGTADDTFMYECGIVMAFVPLGKITTLLFAGN